MMNCQKVRGKKFKKVARNRKYSSVQQNKIVNYKYQYKEDKKCRQV